MSIVITAGQRADSPQFDSALGAVATRYEKLAVRDDAPVLAAVNEWC
ncbi:hypothetical protein [Streptomyces sp. NBC_00490]